MIKAIIFDCFGVLATEAWLPFKEQHFGHDAALMQEATEISREANAGLISFDDFTQKIAKMAGVTEGDVRLALRHNVPNEPLFEYIKSLKPSYKIGFLSNSASDRVKTIFTPAQIALFDTIVLSYAVGTAKPNPSIYKLTAEKLTVEPAECAFVDDQEWYVDAARDLGMQGICYQSFQQFKADLEKVLAK